VVKLSTIHSFVKKKTFNELKMHNKS